jgi:superfamily II DNA or RNA helicase
MHRFRPEEFGLLVIDEAHRSVADTYREVVNHYCGPAALLGVTATPDRHDEQALGQVYRTVAFDYELTDAIAEGWLVPIRQKFLSVELDLSGTRYTLGDFHGADLRALLAAEDTLERIASDAVQWAGERRTLVFADCVANAERLTVALNRHRLGCAALVTGELPDPERRRVIADYRAGATQYLVNVGIATEGFNVPDISCVVMARPTASRSLYTQMAGRGTRALAGVLDDIDTAAARCAAIAASDKRDLLLLDVVGNSARHKLITAADILGGQYDTAVVERAERTLRDGKVPTDVAAALETAQREHNAALRAKAEARERLTLRQKSKARDVDPFDVLGIAPHAPRGWQSQCLASDEQREKLKRWGFDRVEQQTEASAAQLIDAFRARCRRGLATYKQSKVLISRWGMKPEAARETSFEEASRLITILANNGWRRPAGATV